MLVALRGERLPTSWIDPAGTRPSSPARSRSTCSPASPTVVSASSPSTTTKAPLASRWSCRPTDLAGRPAEEPHLVGGRGEEAAAHPLVGVVGDVRPPQRLGARQPGDDVTERIELEAPCCGGRQDGARRRCGGHDERQYRNPDLIRQELSMAAAVWYERPVMSAFEPTTIVPDDVDGEVFVHVIGATVWTDERPADGGVADPRRRRARRRRVARRRRARPARTRATAPPSTSTATTDGPARTPGWPPVAPCSSSSGAAPTSSADAAARRPSRRRGSGRCAARRAGCRRSRAWRRR